MHAGVWVTNYIGGMSSMRRGKGGKGMYDMRVEFNLPPLQGLDVRGVGTMFAAEMVDHIRQQWKQGRTVMGDPVTLSEKGKEIRLVHRKALDEVTLDTKIKRSDRFLKGLMRDYTMLKRSTDYINGIKYKISKKAKYVPDNITTALYSSGLMHDSLSGGYVRASTRVINGQTVQTKAFLRLRVSNNRNQAAHKYGGMTPETATRIKSLISRYPNNFRYTIALIKGFLWWGENPHVSSPQQRMVSISNVITGLMKVMQYINRA